MRRHMVIEIDHLSWKAIDDTLSIAKDNEYPVISGHSGYIETAHGQRKHEAQKNATQLATIARLGGMVGVITAQGSTKESHAWSTGLANNCSQSSKTFSSCISLCRRHASPKALGGRESLAVALATDFMGGVNQPGPRFGDDACTDAEDRDREKTLQEAEGKRVSYPFSLPGRTQAIGESVIGQRTFDFNTDGLAHVGMLPDFIADLRAIGLGPDDLKPLFSSAEGYIPHVGEGRGATARSAATGPAASDIDYGERTQRGGTVTVFVADWRTGASVEGQVWLDGTEKGPVGASINYEYSNAVLYPSPEPLCRRRQQYKRAKKKTKKCVTVM